MPVLCLLSLIYRNSPKQLGMMSPELLAGLPGPRSPLARVPFAGHLSWLLHHTLEEEQRTYQ